MPIRQCRNNFIVHAVSQAFDGLGRDRFALRRAFGSAVAVGTALAARQESVCGRSVVFAWQSHPPPLPLPIVRSALGRAASASASAGFVQTTAACAVHAHSAAVHCLTADDKLDRYFDSHMPLLDAARVADSLLLGRKDAKEASALGNTPPRLTLGMAFPVSDAARRSDGVARLMDFGEYSHASAAESRSLSPLSATPSPTGRSHTDRQLLVETSPGDAWQVWTPTVPCVRGLRTVEYRLAMPVWPVPWASGWSGRHRLPPTTGNVMLLFSGL